VSEFRERFLYDYGSEVLEETLTYAFKLWWDTQLIGPMLNKLSFRKLCTLNESWDFDLSMLFHKIEVDPF
jgi:hypothetical protein